MNNLNVAIGLCRGIEACEKAVKDMQKEFKRLGCDYSVEYHPLKHGVEIIDNPTGMTQFDFKTLGEALRYFQEL